MRFLFDFIYFSLKNVDPMLSFYDFSMVSEYANGKSLFFTLCQAILHSFNAFSLKMHDYYMKSCDFSMIA